MGPNLFPNVAYTKDFNNPYWNSWLYISRSPGVPAPDGGSAAGPAVRVRGPAGGRVLRPDRDRGAAPAAQRRHEHGRHGAHRQGRLRSSHSCSIPGTGAQGSTRLILSYLRDWVLYLTLFSLGLLYLYQLVGLGDRERCWENLKI